MKIKSLLAVAVLTLAAGSSFAENITLIQDKVDTTKYSGVFGATHSAQFTDTFTFSPTLSSSLVSSSLQSIGFTAAADIDFTSVTLNGIALTLNRVGPLDYAFTSAPFPLTGALTLIVSGKSGTNASYSGTINMNAVTAAVPEPETFAMLGAGLAVVGFAARRRKAANQA